MELVGTPETAVALGSSRTARMLQPAAYGGQSLPVDEFVSAVYELAAVDGSLGWLATVFNAAAVEVAGLPAYAMRDVWDANPGAPIALGNRGSGTHADGRLTGHWDSVVGAEQAEWLLLAVDDRPAGRVLVPRSGVRIEPVGRQTGLGAAGICDVTVWELAVDERHVFTSDRHRAAVIAAAGAAAAVVGSADGVWRKHVERVRARLATSHGGDEVTDEAAAQVARVASDIDAAKLQITTSLRGPAAGQWACRQAIARACDAADRLLASSRHALDASDSVTRSWRDVHAGSRLAVQFVDQRQCTPS